MKKKRILAMILAVASCLSLAVSASAANTVNRKAADFKDYNAKSWYAEAVSAAVDNGLLYGKSSTIIDPNGDMTRAEMAAIINRSFGCYVKADISKYTDVAKSKWYYKANWGQCDVPKVLIGLCMQNVTNAAEREKSIKSWLNRSLSKKITKEDLEDIDAWDEIKLWFKKIRDIDNGTYVQKINS